MWCCVATRPSQSYSCGRASSTKSPIPWIASSVIRHRFQLQSCHRTQQVAAALAGCSFEMQPLNRWAESAPVPSEFQTSKLTRIHTDWLIVWRYQKYLFLTHLAGKHDTMCCMFRVRCPFVHVWSQSPNICFTYCCVSRGSSAYLKAAKILDFFLKWRAHSRAPLSHCGRSFYHNNDTSWQVGTAFGCGSTTLNPIYTIIFVVQQKLNHISMLIMTWNEQN